MDGHRTGVRAVAGSDWESALGSIQDGSYVSPSGAVFSGGVTPEAAKVLLDVQPGMSYLKEILGHSPAPMTKGRPESPLSNWAVDGLMKGVEHVTGRKVDVGITNMGGIRTDMPAGDVLMDDIVSMFPFKNTLCYIALKGKDLRAVFEQMASTRVEALGGVELVVNDGAVESVLIGGKPLEDSGIYGLATIDFLLDGGDGLSLAKNAKELIITDVLLNDWFVSYCRELNAAGEMISASEDGRVVVK